MIKAILSCDHIAKQLGHRRRRVIADRPKSTVICRQPELNSTQLIPVPLWSVDRLQASAQSYITKINGKTV